MKRSIASIVAGAILAACGTDAPVAGGDRPGTAGEPSAGTPMPSTAGLPAATGEPGAASGSCSNGWTVPEDPEQRELPFHVIRRTMQVDGEFRLVEMRYFEGPESPPSDKGYAQVVDRWYVKASLKGDRSFGGRWLIEERTYGSGVVAVAPFESGGFESPDWVGFLYEGGEADRRRYPGLPGRWAGTPYDFVTGEGAFDFPGLPDEVRGCLTGT